MTKVKICGLMKPEDAAVAVEAGADFVGMIFVPQRRRLLEASEGNRIAIAAKSSSTPGENPPKIVGNFANQSLDEVNRLIDACQLDYVQLCGQESLEFCGQANAKVIKVIHVDPSAMGREAVQGIAELINHYTDAGHMVTLDRLEGGLQGGTGQAFNWEVAGQLSRDGLSFVLAGGLTPDNVVQAIGEVQPWGVDVSSGVETNGEKDQVKIRDFIQNARLVKRSTQKADR